MKRTIIASLMVFALGCNTAAEKTSKTGSVVAGLKTFGSCSELSGFLSSKAGTGTATPGTASTGTATGGAAADAPAPTATPQTTVPEEADLVKQDGNRLYILNASSGLLIYDLTTPSHPERLGRLPFQGTTPLEIQVSGQDVLVVSLSYGNAPAAPRSVMGMPVYAPPTTQATVLDVS